MKIEDLGRHPEKNNSRPASGVNGHLEPGVLRVERNDKWDRVSEWVMMKDRGKENQGTVVTCRARGEEGRDAREGAASGSLKSIAK